jgi:hypothetical protein
MLNTAFACAGGVDGNLHQPVLQSNLARNSYNFVVFGFLWEVLFRSIL